MPNKMTVEIWSDIMCPFCYIGKRNYEAAIKAFPGREQVTVQWRSFQLDPTIPATPGRKQNVYEYLAEKKAMPYDRSVQLHAALVEKAAAAGLTYRFDQAIVANSFNAHRFIQLAKTKDLGGAAEERLFAAYFTEGKDFGDPGTLRQLGADIGLTESDVDTALQDERYADAVRSDIAEAEQLGIQGVPFFVFDRKYAVSGAQPSAAFTEALTHSFSEWTSATGNQAF